MRSNSTAHPVPLVLRLLQLSFRYLGPVFPDYFSRRAFHIWFTPQRFKPPEREQHALKTAICSTILIKDIPIRIYRWGEGPQILFIHGWSGRGTQAAHFIDSLTSAGFSVLSFDAPAHGATPGKQTNIVVISEVVTELHKQLGRFHAAITHSFGGMILPYSIKQGVRVGRIASICPADGLDTLLRNFQRQLNIPDKVLTLMLNSLRREYGDEMYEKISTVSNVATLDIPGLVIHDEQDTEIPWQSGKQVADAWPGAEFRLTHNLGHRRILRDPETVSAVVEFVTRV
jgi:pimeloyl-ACP methyl ester carboxylesterase